MIKEETNCVDCGFPCRGSACKNFKVPVYYCDRCGLPIDGAVYEKNGSHLCENCMVKKAKDNIYDIFEDYEDEILECLGYVKER